MNKTVFLIAALLLVMGGVVVVAIDRMIGPTAVTGETDTAPSQPTLSAEYSPPSLDDVPEGPLGEAILYGYQLIHETNTMLPDYVGNELSCSSCHANAGLDLNVSPFVGVAAFYPEYRPREGVVFTLEDRINGCFLRSMNGKPLPHDSPEMRAMIAYMTYISQGVPVGGDVSWRADNNMKNVPIPNLEEGEKLYQQSCASCHGVDGSGIGPNTGPALWGDKSFNDGAGMARLSKMAAYIQNNMPIGQEKTLTDQQAADIAAYILSHDRPEWAGKENDWPKGGRPKDIIDKQKREQIRNGTINWEEIVSPNP